MSPEQLALAFAQLPQDEPAETDSPAPESVEGGRGRGRRDPAVSSESDGPQGVPEAPAAPARARHAGRRGAHVRLRAAQDADRREGDGAARLRPGERRRRRDGAAGVRVREVPRRGHRGPDAHAGGGRQRGRLGAARPHHRLEVRGPPAAQPPRAHLRPAGSGSVEEHDVRAAGTGRRGAGSARRRDRETYSSGTLPAVRRHVGPGAGRRGEGALLREDVDVPLSARTARRLRRDRDARARGAAAFPGGLRGLPAGRRVLGKPHLAQEEPRLHGGLHGAPAPLLRGRSREGPSGSALHRGDQEALRDRGGGARPRPRRAAGAAPGAARRRCFGS